MFLPFIVCEYALFLFIGTQNGWGQTIDTFYKLQGSEAVIGYAENISAKTPEECTLW